MALPQLFPITLIGGPTASGKSALALFLAERIQGSIINADSMQVYKELPLLTAQPSRKDQNHISHFLYSIFQATDVCSVGRWQKLALEAIDRSYQGGLTPIVVGGTGLYLSSLTRGIAAVPDIPLETRQHARHLWDTLGPEGFYRELRIIDPLIAQHLRPQDQQRLIRAYEVKKATHISLREWQKASDKNIQHLRSRMIVLLPPRTEVYEKAEQRLNEMLKNGALEEIKAFTEQLPSAHLPLVKALGFRPWRSYLEGQLSYEEALARTLLDTRHYIKRQYTWFRHQVENALYIESFPSKREREDILKWLLSKKDEGGSR